MRWLRFEQRCMIVICGRTPREICGLPDVLGVKCSRYATEIEIKRTFSDFRADARKHCRVNREHYKNRMPKQFYYFVPGALYQRVLAELPPWAGLMTVNDGVSVEVVRTAPVNNDSQRYSVRECVKLAEKLCNQIVSSEEARESVTSQFRWGHEPYWKPDFEI